MKYLQKISISNVRRFGKDVEINFGQGATILLAPNGIGKTTVFEAIELALAGKISRLKNGPLEALIRDGQPGLDVRLDFSDNIFCEVAYRKGKEPVLKGNHDKLFSGNSIVSINYLLRLTHLLDQRGKNWFVDSEEKDAGNRLDQLSIGRELNQILSKRQSVLNAIGKENSRTEDKLLLAKEKLLEFEKLLKERKEVTQDISLIPLTKINSQITSSYKLISNTAKIVEKKVNSIIAFAEQTKSAIRQKINDNSERKVQFTQLEELVELYCNNQKSISRKQKEISDSKNKSKYIKKNLLDAKKLYNEENQKIKNQQNEITKLIELKDIFNQLEIKNKEKELVKKEIADFNQKLPRVKNELKSINEKLEKANTLVDKHKFIKIEIEKTSKEINLLKNLEILQKEWKKYFESISKLTQETIPNVEKQKGSIENNVSSINIELESARVKYGEKKNALSSLKETSDAIQEAVSIIASNMPKDSRDCPVCGANYEPHDLQKRITKALNAVNPLISDAVLEEKKTSEQLEVVNKKYNAKKEHLGKVISELEEGKAQLKKLNLLIDGEILPKFPNCNTPNNALRYLKDKNEVINKNLAKLDKSRGNLEDEPTFDEINAIKLRKGEFERKVEEFEKELNNNKNRQIIIEEDSRSIKTKLGDKSKEKTQSDIEKKELDIKNLGTKLLETKNKQEAIKEDINEIQKQIIAENEIISKLKSQQDGIQEKWENAELSGNPNIEILAESKKTLLAKNKTLVDAKENLNKIDEELSRWRTAEWYEKYDREIKEIITPHSEQTYLERLNQKVKSSEDRVNFIKEREKALYAFLGNVKSELSTVHKYLESINPIWVSLLKRVVINPLFSKAGLLKSYTYRNKPFAEVNAMLHGGNVKVADIASEAQLTDLQLTFMLSMAINYQWTPWRALLLDEPTQHHDLVHASSVFNLLRDYIVDLDFQVMMGTHDPVQANFFQRKLQNDGIDVKIYRLKVGDGGVMADCLD